MSARELGQGSSNHSHRLQARALPRRGSGVRRRTSIAILLSLALAGYGCTNDESSSSDEPRGDDVVAQDDAREPGDAAGRADSDHSPPAVDTVGASDNSDEAVKPGDDDGASDDDSSAVDDSNASEPDAGGDEMTDADSGGMANVDEASDGAGTEDGGDPPEQSVQLTAPVTLDDHSESPKTDASMSIGRITVRADPTFGFFWLAPVSNSGTEQFCNLGVSGTFVIDGQELATLATVYAPVYLSALSTSVVCLDPGETGVIWGIPTAFPRSIDISKIEALEYHFVGLPSDPVLERTPGLSITHEVQRQNGLSKVVGELRYEGQSSLAWWRVTVFTVDTYEVVLRGYDLAPDDIGVESGDSWSFETAESRDDVAEAWVFADHSTLKE